MQRREGALGILPLRGASGLPPPSLLLDCWNAFDQYRNRFLTKKMNDTTILVLGWPPDREENMMRVFKAFQLDVRLLEYLEEVCPVIFSSLDSLRFID